ncbi:MAG: Helix-turn-helix domain protein [Dehalococcoidia bacterium]|nr:Helix-turn-helix domain protein [Dehalococcoidia bacterium]
MGNLGEMIKKYRERAGLSQNALARIVSVNPAYINRLEKRGQGAGNLTLVKGVAAAICQNAIERDIMLATAGHLPLSLAKVGADDPTLLLLADILSDSSIPEHDKELFRLHVRLAARPWRDTGL